jgi:hypothetical protein
VAAVCLLVLIADLLSGSVVLTGDNAVLVDLFTNEGWHGLDVVLETRGRAIRRASTGVVQGILRFSGQESDIDILKLAKNLQDRRC